MIVDPEYRALLRAVLESPHDDLPRLVLADWLDEHDGATECPACDGTGFVGSLAKPLFEEHPVTMVAMSLRFETDVPLPGLSNELVSHGRRFAGLPALAGASA